MNKNTAGAVLLVVLAVAGFLWDRPLAVALVVATCALVVITEEMRDVPNEVPRQLSLIPAACSWLTAIAAATALII